MNKIILAGFVAFSLFSFTAHAEGKVAVVKLQAALNMVNEGKRAMASIKSEIDAKQKELDGLKTTIKTMRDALEKEQMVLSKDALESKTQEIQTKMMELQQKAMDYDTALKKKESDNVAAILGKLKLAVADLAKKGGYDMVYENSADVILYTTNAVDITQELVDAYNKSNK
ncbi:OmpH family outer membrane protein [bacterium]|nr:OmpH family outer membrane protein [bacterium]